MKQQARFLWLLTLLAAVTQFALFALNVNGVTLPTSESHSGFAPHESRALLVGLTLLLVNVGPLLGELRRLPQNLLWVPYQDYWFGTPWRRRLVQRITHQVLCLGVALANLFLLMAMQRWIDQGVGRPPTFPEMALVGTAACALIFPLAFARWAFRPTEENR